MEVAELQSAALAIRKKLLRMHFEAKSSHLGTALSEVDLLTYLYGTWLTPEDRFVLSKGHGASGLYATLNHFGRMSDTDLATYYKNGSKLAAHPSPIAFDEIPFATGSLGHGLSLSSGMAYARKLAGNKNKVVCLLSDGECNEGSTWEAALFAGHHQLDRLTVLVDYNGLQGFGHNRDVLNLEPFPEKWTAFGFRTVMIDGHDFKRIGEALQMAGESNRPTCIVAKTIKGKGVSFMEDRLEWHYLNLNEALYAQAIRDLEK